MIHTYMHAWKQFGRDYTVFNRHIFTRNSLLLLWIDLFALSYLASECIETYTEQLLCYDLLSTVEKHFSMHTVI